MLFRSDRKSTRLNSSHTIISYALPIRSEEHTSELQSHDNLVCRLLLEKKKKKERRNGFATPRRSWHGAASPCCGQTCGGTASVGLCSFFFFNDTATTEIYTLSLHDALPISRKYAPTRPPYHAQSYSVSEAEWIDRKSTRLNSSHTIISYAVFCLKKKKN